MRLLKGVILHGGRGTRLRPLTHTGPKQLIPIANKPMSQYALEDLRDAGITDIAVILGDVGSERVREYYGDGSRFGVSLTYIVQGQPKGIAHAVGLVEEFVGGDDFVVYLGDNLLKAGIVSMVEDYGSSASEAMICLCKVNNPSLFGVAEIRDGRITRLVEKPKEPPSDLALVGIYFFKPSIFDVIKGLTPSWRGELEITEALQELIDEGFDVHYHEVSGWWKDTGKPDDILEANQLVLSEVKSDVKGEIGEGVSVTGNVVVGEGSKVMASSSIRGPVIIGCECEIGPNTYIGPYTAIGDKVRVKGCEIENSIVVEGASIEFEGKVVDSIIGSHSVIRSNQSSLPKGYRFIIGESTYIEV